MRTTTVANVGLQYAINVWNRGIFDGTEKRDASTVFFLTGVTSAFLSAATFIVVPMDHRRRADRDSWRLRHHHPGLSRRGRGSYLNIIPAAGAC